jgi:hypothetical protein
METKIEAFWRDATAEDIAKVMKGENVYARFRDRYADGWAEYYLSGVNGKGWIAGNFRWDLCQVYEPQQWYLDKPDPGKGWRLLGKFPDEDLKPGDQAWDLWDDRQWAESQKASGGGHQVFGVWYRRRIEPAKQDAGSTSASNIPKGWTALLLDEPRLESDAYWSQDAEAWVIIGDGWVESANREKWPAIRQVETHKTMMLMVGYHYRLPNGMTIKVVKEGFQVL